MAEDTFATNPVNVKPEFSMVLRLELITLVVISTLVFLVFFPLGWFLWRWLWLGLLLIPAGIWFVFHGNNRLMRLGACCPAKVLSLDPPTLAVFSDMSMGGDVCHPAIIIKQFSSMYISGAPLKVGDRLAVAAFYEAGDELMPEERWKQLSVIQPVRSVTRNPADIQRTLASIEQDEWSELEKGVKDLIPPYEERVIFLGQRRKVGGAGVSEGRIKWLAANDPGMEKTKAYGRKTLRYFLRELAWEKRRIVPGLDMAAIKVAFSDPPGTQNSNPGGLEVEYMWVSEIEFDGRKVSGILLNQPDSIQSVRQGDKITASTAHVVDWLYSVMGEVCGGFTIQELRRKMSPQELAEHDQAWGMDFGTPGVVRLVPDGYLPESAKSMNTLLPDLEGISIRGDYKVIDSLEHPMSVNMRQPLEDMLTKNPGFLDELDGVGLPLLHQMAVAGSFDGVDVCLNFGADPDIEAANGVIAAKLAKSLGWKKVLKRLQDAGAVG